jgi:maltooligosyltrehalose trehalohydrolase
LKIGTRYAEDGTCEFVVWAPLLDSVSLLIVSGNEQLVPMQKDESGCWKTVVKDVMPGTGYLYRLNGERDRPDPASYFQPDGVHKASQVIDHNLFSWQDSNWNSLPLSEMIMYELHAGTFTHDGTFDAVIPRLDDLNELGINAIEIMPVAQFPGERNWGYDGVYPYAVQNSYGGPDGLKRLVDACHTRGIAVILDVVYNHLGPEGNYLWDYGPYFTDMYKTPGGKAVNYDGPYSNGVRNYFIENALYWFEHYHIDALRLDAIHGIYDISAKHVLQELSEKVKEFSEIHGREFYLIAESDLNDPVVAMQGDRGGYGIDSLWCDDFHHSVHTLLIDEVTGYYEDFSRIEHLVKSIKEGFVYSGQYSHFRKKNHGSSSKDLPAERLVVFSQNHDQAGNRMLGERLSSLVTFEAQKLAAGIMLLSPYVPLLFMGEEYGETAPFLYFISHSDQHLIEGIRHGRKKDFEAFNWKGDPPDPDSIETFEKSRIDWNKRKNGPHAFILKLYRELVRLRKEVPALANLDKDCLDVWADNEKKVVFVSRWKDNNRTLALYNFNATEVKLDSLRLEEGMKRVLDSSEEKWDGPGSLLPDSISKDREMIIRPWSFALYANKL